MYKRENQKIFHGTTQRGIHTMSKNQIKKHITQMSMEEKQEILRVVSSNQRRSLYFSHHSKEKIGVDFQERDVLRLLQDPKLLSMIVEVNANFYDSTQDFNDARILVRAKQPQRVMMKDKNTGDSVITLAHLCFVYSLTYHKIVTVYWNRANDHHDTIDMRKYVNTDFLPYIRFKRVQRGVTVGRSSRR